MRRLKENNSTKSVQFEKHQPERRRGIGGRAYCNGGCCCCSCCLHTVGGLLGGIIASSKSRQPADGSVITGYWMVLAVLTVAFIGFASTGGLGMGVIVALLFLPLMQLAASVLVLFWIGIGGAKFPDKKASLLTLGKITLWSFIGALAGAAAMIVGVIMLN